MLGHRCACAPDVAFLFAPDTWLTTPRPVDAALQQWGRAEVPVATFTAQLVLSGRPAKATLRVEAARAHRVRVNGAVVAASPDPDPRWRRGHAWDVAEALHAGSNAVAVEVWNPRGPPLLRVRLELDGKPGLGSGDWHVAVDGAPAVPAVAPDDTRLHPSAPASPRPGRALRSHGPLALVIALLGALGLALARPALERHRAQLPWIALAAVHAGWLALFVGKLAPLPLTTGFDATHHLAYVEMLRREHAVPLPDAGWSTYHPPLYYVLVALLQGTSGAGGVAAKLPSFAAGLATVWVAFGLARTLLPARPALVAVAVLFAGVLPLNVQSAAYVSNEPLHAALFGSGTLLCARALLRPRLRPRDAALVGTVVGLALLTKLTALLLVAVAGGFLVIRVALREGATARVAGIAAAFAAPIVATCGWLYGRNLALYGTPLVGNWNLPGRAWWSQPGFHTPAYYLGFGESLRRPVLAGFHSYGDALYASFWGDGWIAGRASAAFPTEAWSWGWAALGYLLALPASAAIVWGLARMARLAFAPAEGARRAAWSCLLCLVAALGLAMLVLTLDLPYFGQAKASYALGLVGVLAVAFALGAGAVDRALARAGGEAAAQAGRAFWLATAVVLWLSVAA